MNSDTPWMLTSVMRGRNKHGQKRWRRQRTSLQIETLEPRWALAASSGVSPIQAIWFAEVTAETHLQSAGGVGASSVATNNTSAAGAQQSVAYDWIVQFDVGAMGSVSTVADTASLLDDSVVDLQIMRGLGQVGQVLIRTTEADELLVANWLDASDAVAGYMRDSAVYLDPKPSGS